MKTMFQKQPRERTLVYLIIGLFILNAFGLIPLGVIGAYTTPPMKIITTETLDDGTAEKTYERHYAEDLPEKMQSNIYEFFRYSLPVTMTGYFVVTMPEFSYDYVGVVSWILSLVSVPLVMRYTSGFVTWHRCVYVYFIVVQLAGMWALGRVDFECISFIDYPIRPGPPCGI